MLCLARRLSFPVSYETLACGRQSGSMELRETQDDRRGVSFGPKRSLVRVAILGTRRFLVTLSCLLAGFVQDLARLAGGTQRLYYDHPLATRTA